jgi:hypothetical protein
MIIRSEGVGMATFDRFVAALNIRHFKDKLAVEKNEVERLLLLKLLAEEEARLATLEHQQVKE